jgi:Icc protein
VKIHQVTDLHVPDDSDDEMFAYVRSHVSRQFEFVGSEKPDLLVISGDLTMSDASEIGCRWIYQNLPDVPVIVIPGNHDDPKMIKNIFGQWPQQQKNADCSLIFLDSSSGHLPEEQLQLLSKLTPSPPCLLFLHHPPYLIGSGFMSKTQPLLNHREVAQAISTAGIEHVFCGHYHNSAQVECHGFKLYLTPSPAYQVALDSEEFKMEECQPAVRTIDIKSGHLYSDLVYL